MNPPKATLKVIMKTLRLIGLADMYKHDGMLDSGLLTLIKV